MFVQQSTHPASGLGIRAPKRHVQCHSNFVLSTSPGGIGDASVRMLLGTSSLRHYHSHACYSSDASGTGKRCTNNVIQIVTGKMAMGYNLSIS